jgi:bacterioferritin-associated ferredoxin
MGADIDFQFHSRYDRRAAPEARALIVCHCRAKTDREIRRSVRNGAVTLQEVSRACGAATGCGGCARAVQEILVSELGAHEARAADLPPGAVRSA